MFGIYLFPYLRFIKNEKHMKTAQFANIATEKMKVYTTTELVEVANKLMGEASAGKNMIFDSVIDILQSRMTETEFSNLVNSL